jgi:hypothetical protein
VNPKFHALAKFEWRILRQRDLHPEHLSIRRAPWIFGLELPWYYHVWDRLYHPLPALWFVPLGRNGNWGAAMYVTGVVLTHLSLHPPSAEIDDGDETRPRGDDLPWFYYS